MDENFKRLVKSSTQGGLTLFLGQVVSTIVLSIGMLLVARFLGPTDYGAFNKAQSIVQFAYLIIDLGIFWFVLILIL